MWPANWLQSGNKAGDSKKAWNGVIDECMFSRIGWVGFVDSNWKQMKIENDHFSLRVKRELRKK